MNPKYYRDLYRSAYARLGYPLKEKHGVAPDQIAAAEKKLGLKLPVALREYYLVAGAERTVNRANNRLLSPGKWEKQLGKLVIWEENQGGIVWGLTASRQRGEDPVMYQGLVDDGQAASWASEEVKCSTFMVVMLHLQLSFGGGQPFTASGSAPLDLLAKVEKEWQFGGKVNGMRAYSRDNVAVCFEDIKPRDKRKFYYVYAGARSKSALDVVAAALKVTWEDWSWPSGTE